MTPIRDHQYLRGLVYELRSLAHETEWVEFKSNHVDSQDIGEYISALANGAALNKKAHAYLVWGVEDQTHEIIGTTFSPLTTKVGNEPLENWLLRMLDPQVDFHFHEVMVAGCRTIVLEIAAAMQRPVSFGGDDFIRIGSVKKRLRHHPERERDLWRRFDVTSFERGVAAERVSAADVLQQLEYSAYFDLLQLPHPDGHDLILEALSADRLISKCDAGGWNITNLGAVLFARKIEQFPSIARKAVRVVEYHGSGRTSALGERHGELGYAVGFQRLVEYILGRVPANEVIERSLRTTVPTFPEVAVRELVANALIHQDFTILGTGPLVEIFDDRIEITNPGMPLVDTARFVDMPPRSRNEALGALMRRFRICEERGSGIDKVLNEVEIYQLPAPLFEAPGDFTRATLFSHKRLSEMSHADRVRACYLHACLRYVMNQPTNNASIRERFGISKANAAQASKLLKEALESKWIVLRNPEAGFRSRSYLPFWADPRNGDPVV